MKEKWRESIPAPLDLTDTEILDWLDEHMATAIWSRGHGHGQWSVKSTLGRMVVKNDLREAICLAAAYERES